MSADPLSRLLPRRVSAHPRAAGVAGVLLVYAAVVLGLDLLAFPVRKDELHFWPTVQRFAAEPLPSLALLRGYSELSTPLTFLLYGWLEALTGAGIVLARYFNLACSLAVTLAILLAAPAERWRGPLAALGLLAFPYYLGVSAHAYTDVIAAALVLAGLAAHLRGRWVLGAVALILAVSARQYMVAFPAALLVWELWRLHAPPPEGRPALAWLGPAVACASLLGWVAVFGGLAPAGEVARQQIGTAGLLALRPAHALYFLATVGVYYVGPEWVLLGRPWRPYIDALLQRLASPSGALIALVLLGLFLLFPPLRNTAPGVTETMGYLDRALGLVLPDVARMAVYYAAALAACLRFARPELAALLVLANAGLMLKAHLGWDKYVLPLLVVLWFLQARGALHTPGDPPATRAGGAGAERAA